jgi:hypothetical protein
MLRHIFDKVNFMIREMKSQKSMLEKTGHGYEVFVYFFCLRVHLEPFWLSALA